MPLAACPQNAALNSCLRWLVSLGCFVCLSGVALAERPLLNIHDGIDLSTLQSQAVELSIVSTSGQAAIRMESTPNQDWPGITLRLGKQSRDLSPFDYLAVDVRNTSDREVAFAMRVDSVDGEQRTDTKTEQQTLAPGELQTVRLSLDRKLPKHLEGRLIGMRSNPAGLSDKDGLAVDSIEQIILFVFNQPYVQAVEISNLRATGSYEAGVWFDSNRDPFPMIDRFGQFMHADWPGKTHSQAELSEAVERERIDLAAHPKPGQWDEFGGYAAGPQLATSQRFRVEKYQDRWWLVDPAGHLFWSHGIDCVNSSNATTPISDREFYFAELPPADSPLAIFYGEANWAPHGYYLDRGRYKVFNFTGANLVRKYGENWRTVVNQHCHARLRSWGMNTIANWSEASVYQMKQTPYTLTSTTGGRPIEGSSGYWGRFPDPFDAGFSEATQRQMAHLRDDANTTWCVGVFVDNELAWGDETSLAVAALQSPSDQPAKLAFVDDLKKKYDGIQLLNSKWGTEYKSWDAVLSEQTAPDADRARDDLRAFYTRLADEYFRVCRDAVKAISPDTLYLGCRFAWANDRAVRSAAKYCDVIAFNRYEYSVADYKLPDGIDKPAIIGEYHFGALDRGLFHTGLKPTDNQRARASAYRDYVTGALKNSIWVGAHWFQYGDQAATGRGDGENYQIGFVDVCDTPYQETIEAARQIGRTMYALRLEP
ncbi:MAG: beta-galactosidase [Pirellulaceae bacterium]|nr:beta-galactosidase [Pirellulaceae bacterium]